MVIGSAKVTLHIPFSRSLKDKRNIIRRFKERLRLKFNVAVSEVDAHEKWQRAELGLVTVGTDAAIVRHILEDVLDHIRLQSDIQLGQSEIEIL
jgi:hypothetical protein